MIRAYKGFEQFTWRKGERSTMTLNLNLDEQQTLKLKELSQRLNVPVGVLAKAAINDLLAKPESDFQQAATRVLEKNAELYKRLAQ